MIVLDTNVISELLRPAPARRVVEWFDAQPRAALFTTTLTQGEVLYGVRLLPEGQPRRGLQEAVGAVFDQDFAGRVLGFDSEAATLYAEIAASRRAAGRPITQFDAMIAAVARSRGAMLATRNIDDFDLCGVDVVNPWKE